MKTVRLKQMEQFIMEHEFVRMDELCERFKIHPNTARSDIRELTERGVVKKQYGGVSYVTSNLPVSFTEKQQTNMLSKQRIGQAAAGYLEEDDVIFVDSGTTTLMLFQDMPAPLKNLTIITNNLDVLYWVLKNTEYTIFALPGNVNRQLNAVASLETIESLKSYNFRKAFIGTRGISSKGELCSTSNIDAKLKSIAIEISDTVILMADSNKINQSAMFNFASLRNVDYWICGEVTQEASELSCRYNIEIVGSHKIIV